jgi:hypothetical protein
MNATMNASRSFGTFRFARPLSRAERIARLDKLATLLDIAFRIPFTKFRFGVDGLIGLAPGFGDIVTTGLSLWIVHEAYQLGVPRQMILRMLGNVAIDGMIGAVPVAGDVFDVLWRANRRNVRILREHFEREERGFR